MIKKTNRLWIEILNTSYFERLKIKNKAPLGFLVIEPENLKVEYYEARKRSKQQKALPKNWSETRARTTDEKRRRQRQTGGFLNRYGFAYAGRDTVNQVGEIVPAIIKQATQQIDKIFQDRINQVIRLGGAEIERVLPKILHGAIEDVYKTPFRLLGDFGKQQFNKIKRKILH